MLNEIKKVISHTFSTASCETDQDGNKISVKMVRKFNTEGITIDNIIYCLLYWAVIKLRDVEDHKKLTVEQLEQLNGSMVSLYDLFNTSRKKINPVTDDTEFIRICRLRGMSEDDIKNMLSSMKN